MSIMRSMSKRAIKIATALALVAVMAVSLLTACAGQPGSQFTAQCSDDIPVPNPANSPGLVSDCATLLAIESTLEGTDGDLNWSPSIQINEWDGVAISDNRVTSLSLERLRLNGEIPPDLGNLDNLMELHLNVNQLTGAIPSELGDLDNLTELTLSANQLTGTIPSELGNLANLMELHLSANQLTGAIPPELGNLSNLTELDLNDNQLTGAIPEELGNLDNLGRLYLYDNHLTGEIPEELGNADNLRNLYLYNNQLTGAIPEELGNLPYLWELHLSDNQLTGEIPPELGNPNDLWLLALTNNQLTGKIPPELGNLSNLKSLNLAGNQLTGEIPPELGGLNKLWGLSLADNQFTGCLPWSLSVQLNIDQTEWNGLPICDAPTATPLPTPTSAPSASGGACIERLTDSGRVSSRWVSACLSANPPNDDAYYARFYTFTLGTAALVTITLSSADAVPYFYLLEGEGTDGTVRLHKGDESVTSVATTVSLPAGNYTIESSTWDAETTGDFTLEVDITQP